MSARNGERAATIDPSFAEAHGKLLADHRIQFDLGAYAPPRVPAWLQALVDFLGDAFPVLRVLFWVLVALAAAVILSLIANRLWGVELPWRRVRSAPADAEPWRPAEAPARALLKEADVLAAQGRYSEAAHLLLHRSIADIDARRPRLVRPALTSRDIARADDIPGGPREAFAAIVAAVERSLFGGRALGEADWRDCRESYEKFAFAGAWRA